MTKIIGETFKLNKEAQKRVDKNYSIQRKKDIKNAKEYINEMSYSQAVIGTFFKDFKSAKEHLKTKKSGMIISYQGGYLWISDSQAKALQYDNAKTN